MRNPRQHPKIAVLRLPPSGPALHPRPRSARPRPLLGPPFRRKNEFAVGTQGKPVKALSPNCRGGSFTGRRQTAATPHAPPSGRAAGIRTEPAGAQPPHSCERLTRLWPAVHTPDGAGVGPGHVPRINPSFVHVFGPVSGPVLAGACYTPVDHSLQGRGGRQDRPGRTVADGPLSQRQHHAGAAERPRSPHSVAGERQRHCRPGRFLLLGAHSVG